MTEVKTPQFLPLDSEGGELSVFNTSKLNTQLCPFPPSRILHIRICPGMHLADKSIFIAIASLLAVFDFSKAKDKYGGTIEPEVDYAGFIRYAVSNNLRRRLHYMKLIDVQPPQAILM